MRCSEGYHKRCMLSRLAQPAAHPLRLLFPILPLTLEPSHFKIGIAPTLKSLAGHSSSRQTTTPTNPIPAPLILPLSHQLQLLLSLHTLPLASAHLIQSHLPSAPRAPCAHASCAPPPPSPPSARRIAVHCLLQHGVILVLVLVLVLCSWCRDSLLESERVKGTEGLEGSGGYTTGGGLP
jgi:hypothetical protein